MQKAIIPSAFAEGTPNDRFLEFFPFVNTCSLGIGKQVDFAAKTDEVVILDRQGAILLMNLLAAWLTGEMPTPSNHLAP